MSSVKEPFASRPDSHGEACGTGYPAWSEKQVSLLAATF